jgi:hypothetical protein
VNRWPSSLNLLDLVLPNGGAGLQGASLSLPPGSSGLPWNQPSWPSLLLRGQRAGGLPYRMLVCGLLAGLGHQGVCLPLMAAGPAASFLSWGCQSAAPTARNGVVPVCPLHRHEPCASALIFIRPARSVRSSQPVDCLSASGAAGQGSARPPAPSVLVVPPDFDGLLRASPCGLVASRSRPWGSSRFQTPATDREWDMGISHATRGASARDLFPGTHDPSKPFPCTQPSYA